MTCRLSYTALLVTAFLFVVPAQGYSQGPLERTHQALDQPVKVQFVDTPFKDVIAALADQTGVPIAVLRETYEAGYVLRDQPLTVELRDISLRSALNLILDRLSLGYLTTDRGEILIVSATSSPNRVRTLSKVQEHAAQRNREILERKEVTLQCVDTPFKDVVAYVADDVGATMVVDRDAIEAVGLSGDSPVTIDIGKMPAYRALTAFLYPYDLDFQFRDEVIFVTLRDDRQPRRPISAELRRAAQSAVKVELLDPPLYETVAELAEQANVIIRMDHRRMERARIAYDKRVVGPLPKMPLKDALQRTLEPIGLNAMVYNDVVFITPLPVTQSPK